MQKYELLLVLPGTLDDKGVAARSEEIVADVKGLASDVVVNTMGKNRLAYPIKQIRYGYYFAITFMAEPQNVKTLEKKLVLQQDLLRANISHFRSDLSAAQKAAYTAQNQPEARVAEEMSPERIAHTMSPVVEVVEEKTAKPEKKTKEKGEEELDMAAINKKLDDIMSGDVIPGV